MARSSPSVPCKIKHLKSVTHPMTDSSIKTCLMNDDKFTVPTGLEASCLLPAKFVAGRCSTGPVLSPAYVPLQKQEVKGILTGDGNDNVKPDMETSLECLPCLETSTF